MTPDERSDLIKMLDARYVRIEDCKENTSSIKATVNKDNVRLAVMEQQQKINNWLTLAIASGVIALVIKIFLGG